MKRLRQWLKDWWNWHGYTLCVTCRRLFRRCNFWNPWGLGRGPGLACSERCCDAAKAEAKPAPPQGETP